MKPNNRAAAESNSRQRQLTLRRVLAGTCMATLQGHGSPVACVAFASAAAAAPAPAAAADGGIANGTAAGAAPQPQVEQPPPQGHEDGQQQPPAAPRLPPLLASGSIRGISLGGQLRVWDLETRACTRTLDGHGRAGVA